MHFYNEGVGGLGYAQAVVAVADTYLKAQERKKQQKADKKTIAAGGTPAPRAGAGSAGTPAPRPGSGSGGTVVSPPISVSPAIQTTISPQISPVFTQIQDSPYASTSGAPVMTTYGGQSADTGADMPGIPGAGYSRPSQYNPFDEFGRPRQPLGYPQYPPSGMVTQMGGGYQDLLKWGIIGTIALVGIKTFMKMRPRSYRGNTYSGTAKRLA